MQTVEEDNLSPFDVKTACLCQSIEINNNKHVYRQSQVRKPHGSEVMWAECSLIIGTGCWVEVFSLILDSSIGLRECIQSAGEQVSWDFQVRILHSAEEVEIDTCAFQTGCQLTSAASGMSLELCFLTHFQWRDAIVPDNWQLAELPQSGGRVFDPNRVHDNLSVTLWVYKRFPVPEHQNKPNKYVYRQRQDAVQN